MKVRTIKKYTINWKRFTPTLVALFLIPMGSVIFSIATYKSLGVIYKVPVEVSNVKR